MKKIIALVLCFALSGCASWTMFDAPEYWYKTNRAPNPNAPTIRALDTASLCGVNSAGCYWNEIKIVSVSLTAEESRCVEAHENAHACGWDHDPDAPRPNSESDRCGYHIPRCK